MNSKGQAFSVFQLLISAIVAFAILYILLTILIFPNPGPTPNESAKQLLTTAQQQVGSAQISGEVGFENMDNLVPTAIAEGTGITASQICVLKHDFKDNADFRFTEATNALYYYGSGLVKTKISVVCERSGELEQILQAAPFNESVTITPGIANDIACGTSCDAASTKTCCAVLVKFPR